MNVEMIAEKVKENFSKYMVNMESGVDFLKEFNGTKPSVSKDYDAFLSKYPEMNETLSGYKNVFKNDFETFKKSPKKEDLFKNSEMNYDLSILDLRDRMMLDKDNKNDSIKFKSKNKI